MIEAPSYLGLIPALAGKTRPGRQRRSRRPAHPRAGGENISARRCERNHRGSSPRWRGKRSGELRSGKSVRLIPALAGKTSWSLTLEPWLGAHPRAGGENVKAFFTLPNIFGSSPRWRGKPSQKCTAFIGVGLIPALAGKTCLSRYGDEGTQAHPRAGGENANRACVGSN